MIMHDLMQQEPRQCTLSQETYDISGNRHIPPMSQLPKFTSNRMAKALDNMISDMQIIIDNGGSYI